MICTIQCYLYQLAQINFNMILYSPVACSSKRGVSGVSCFLVFYLAKFPSRYAGQRLLQYAGDLFLRVSLQPRELCKVSSLWALPLIAIMWHRQFHSLSCHKWKLSQRYRLRFVCTIVQDNRRREKALVYLVDTLSRTEHTIPCPKRQKTKAFVFMPRYTWLISIDAGILHNIEENEKQYLLFSPWFFLQSFQVFSADPFVQCICWWRCFLDCFLAFLRAFMTLLLAFNVTGDIMNRSTINEREIKELPVQMVLQGLFCGLHEKEKKGIPRSKDERLIIHMIYEAEAL